MNSAHETPSSLALVAPAATEPIPDSRIAMFCSPLLSDLFHAFAYTTDVWKADPFDVESIHAGARSWFDRTVNRVLEPTGLASGRILLLLGESGSGKTHLMRAFRNRVHSQHRGYCGYMQMTAFTGQYGRYVLTNLVESLDKPYFEPESPITGLMRLSNALVDSLGGPIHDELQPLRDAEADQATIDRTLSEVADRVILDDRFRDVDVFLVQALLYLQCNDPRIKARVLKYLRCEDLTEHDRRLLGGIVPCTYPDAPHWVIQRLGQVIHAVEKVPLILCVDQLEDVFDLDEAALKFRRAMATLCDLVSRLPSAIVVVSCLENFYDELKKLLTRPIKDRVENDPRPVSLQTPCDRGDVERLIGRRLRYLFERNGEVYEESKPTYPCPESLIRSLIGLRARDVLLECQLYRDRCVEEGKMADYPFERDGGERPDKPSKGIISLEQDWNDFRSSFVAIVPADEAELAMILSQSLLACTDEMETGHRFEATVDGRFITVNRHRPDHTVEHLKVGICNKESRGGGLGRQVQELINQSSQQTAVAVRSTSYPSSPTAVVTRLLQEMVNGGGRQVVVEDSDWRTMMVFARFLNAHEAKPGFDSWRRRTRPLSSLNSLRAILGQD